MHRAALRDFEVRAWSPMGAKSAQAAVRCRENAECRMKKRWSDASRRGNTRFQATQGHFNATSKPGRKDEFPGTAEGDNDSIDPARALEDRLAGFGLEAQCVALLPRAVRNPHGE